MSTPNRTLTKEEKLCLINMVSVYFSNNKSDMDPLSRNIPWTNIAKIIDNSEDVCQNTWKRLVSAYKRKTEANDTNWLFFKSMSFLKPRIRDYRISQETALNQPPQVKGIFLDDLQPSGSGSQMEWNTNSASWFESPEINMAGSTKVATSPLHKNPIASQEVFPRGKNPQLGNVKAGTSGARNYSTPSEAPLLHNDSYKKYKSQIQFIRLFHNNESQNTGNVSVAETQAQDRNRKIQGNKARNQKKVTSQQHQENAPTRSPKESKGPSEENDDFFGTIDSRIMELPRSLADYAKWKIHKLITELENSLASQN